MGDVVKAIFPTAAEDLSIGLKVTRATFWAAASTGVQSFMAARPGTLVTGNSNLGQCTDIGSGVSLAGITFEIPDTIALTNSGDATSTTVLFDQISTSFDGTGSGSWVCDLSFLWRM